MTALDKVPNNKNFLSRGGFKLTIQRAPHLNFFAQRVNIPGLSIPSTSQPNHFVEIPHSGEHIDFDIFAVTFKVDEDLKNYMEMHNWIRGLGFPDNYGEYATLASGDKILGQGIKSDISFFILSSHRNPIFEVVFKDAFPVSLQGLEFDSTLEEVDYLDCTVTFMYTSYRINPVT